jgi:hypothetical protein
MDSKSQIDTTEASKRREFHSKGWVGRQKTNPRKTDRKTGLPYNQIGVRLSPQQMEMISAAAAQHGLTPAAFLRSLGTAASLDLLTAVSPRKILNKLKEPN